MRDEGAGLGRDRDERLAWVARHVVPHEAALRARLLRMVSSADQVDDIIQDAYLSLSRLESVAHIRNGRAYLFTTARSVLLQKLRRERLVRIDSLTELHLLTLEDDAPDPERDVGAKRELDRVRRLIAALPDRCREIFELRRVQGLPQREIAARLDLPEHTIEQQAIRGLKIIMRAIADEEREAPSREVMNGRADG
ncbi:MAG: RNA polymerase sigma factor [Sphingomonadales bacterium]|nr:MAG: RNA polymerase sigma factor [Sphingomonadales bacterium]